MTQVDGAMWRVAQNQLLEMVTHRTTRIEVCVVMPEERPGWTRFGHDVWMDGTEMTQREYASLLRRNPSTVRGDSLPATDVSWHDAVLCANARSRRDGPDTVYEYGAITGDASGNATDLAGLTVHLDRAGWRLPTEAEWEAATRAGTTMAWSLGGMGDSSQADEHAWYQKNGGGAYQDGKHGYVDAEAVNTDHLNLAGAIHFTDRLDDTLWTPLAE